MTTEKKPYGYIYKVTNTQNGKNYIGKAERERFEKENKDPIRGRWEEQLSKAEKLNQLREQNPDKKIRGRHIENAINKYGPESFKLKKLDTADSLKDLNAKERHYIKKYDSMNPNKGYNLTEGGDFGRLRPEIREKTNQSIRKARIKNWKDAKYREKQSKARSKTMTERWKNPEYKKHMRQKSKENWKDPNYRQKQSKARSETQKENWKDPKIREKHRIAQSRAQKENWKDPKYREKQSKTQRKAMSERWKNPEYKKSMSQKSKENWKDPIYREKVSKNVSRSMKEKWSDLNYKEKMSNIHRETWKNPEVKDKHSKATKSMWKDSNYRNKVSKAIKEGINKKWNDPEFREEQSKVKSNEMKEKWKDPKFREKMSSSLKKHIENKRDFLNDVKNKVAKKNLVEKYNIGDKAMNRRIEEMLGEHGVKNYTEAKKYLQNKNLDDIVKDIEDRSGEKQGSTVFSDNNVEDSAKDLKGENENRNIDNKPSEEKKETPPEDKSDKANEEEKVDKKEELPNALLNETANNQSKESLEQESKEKKFEISGIKDSEQVTQGLIADLIKEYEDTKAKEISERGPGWYDDYDWLIYVDDLLKGKREDHRFDSNDNEKIMLELLILRMIVVLNQILIIMVLTSPLRMNLMILVIFMKSLGSREKILMELMSTRVRGARIMKG